MKVTVTPTEVKDERNAEQLGKLLTFELRQMEPCLLCGHVKVHHESSGCDYCSDELPCPGFSGIWEQL